MPVYHTGIGARRQAPARWGLDGTSTVSARFRGKDPADATLDVCPRYQDHPPAATALQTNIGPDTEDAPASAAARVGLLQFDLVSEMQGQGLPVVGTYTRGQPKDLLT